MMVSTSLTLKVFGIRNLGGVSFTFAYLGLAMSPMAALEFLSAARSMMRGNLFGYWWMASAAHFFLFSILTNFRTCEKREENLLSRKLTEGVLVLEGAAAGVRHVAVVGLWDGVAHSCYVSCINFQKIDY